jgi:hypothetical protein
MKLFFLVSLCFSSFLFDVYFSVREGNRHFFIFFYDLMEAATGHRNVAVLPTIKCVTLSLIIKGLVFSPSLFPPLDFKKIGKKKVLF